MKSPRSISSEILLVLFLTSTVSLAAWGVYDYSRCMSEARNDLRSSLARKVNRLSLSLVYPVWNLNQEEIEQSLNVEMNSENILAILLHREDGRILAARIKDSHNRIIPYLDDAAGRHRLGAAFAFNSNRITKNNLHIGTVSVYVSDQPMRAELRRHLNYLLLQLVTLSIIITLSIYVTLKRRIINPINALEDSVRSMSPDNLSPAIPYRRNDEIGRLFDSFSQMGAALAESFSSQKLLTDKLRKREEQFRTITSNVPGAIYRMAGDAEQTVLYVSEHIMSITGIAAAEFIGKSRAYFRGMVLEEDRGALEHAEHHAVAGRSSFDVKYRISGQDGQLRWIHEIGQCSTAGDEWFLDGVMIDDTELHEKDMLLMQSQKMETVGVLAGGIAHDFNNILGGIMGSLSMLKLRLPEMSEASKTNVDRYISLIEKSSLRAADMTRQLLSLSKPQQVTLAPVDLCSSLQHVVHICRGTFDKSVSLTTDFGAGPALVNADPVQIEQVLLNLCVNAAHAVTIMRPFSVPWGGAVHLSLMRIPADTENHRLHPAAREIDCWEICVKDSGVGMDDKTLSHVFTPFFTTKQKGAGSGLGLSMAYTIISQHQGFITVQSEPGTGTEFRLYLPVLEGELGDEVIITPEAEIPRGAGTILVVDDEELLRDNARQILTQCGYRVLTAENGEEALQQVELHCDEIRGVLLDMVMPILSGKEVYYRLKESHPRIRILLSSGNRHDDRVEELLKAGVDDFINKPYTLTELARAVYQLMRQEQQGNNKQ